MAEQSELTRSRLALRDAVRNATLAMEERVAVIGVMAAELKLDVGGLMDPAAFKELNASLKDVTSMLQLIRNTAFRALSGTSQEG